MQYLQVGGWQKANALPDSPRVIEKLLAKGWIERSRVPRTASFIESLKKAPGKKTRIP
jgi:hypothetical protein